MKLVSVEQMHAIEREADAKGITYDIMMKNAGEGLAITVYKLSQSHSWGAVMGLVGLGNNGGDTLVALSWLNKNGCNTHAYLIGRSPSGDPLTEAYMHTGGVVIQAAQDEEFIKLKSALSESHVLLDGVLGTGMRLPLRDEIGSVLLETKSHLASLKQPPFVIAVDCPSGVNCDTGEAAEQTIRADLTVTMAAIKQGLLKLPAFEFTGNLQVVDIGLPPDLISWNRVTSEMADAGMVAGILPRRGFDAHKGTFGSLFILAGSTTYTGAALLSAAAAYRSGIGLVRMGVPAPLHAAISGQLPETTWVLLPEESGYLAESAGDIILQSLDRITAVLVGPGMGTLRTTRNLIELLLEKVELPLVVDADGLRLMGLIPSWEKRLAGFAILTPHPGEMSALTGLPIGEIQANRIEIASQYSKLWGHIVVLKGAFTVVAAPDGRTAVIPVATPALARAGTGDVLSGLIAGLRGQGIESFEAAVAGAYIHGKAGFQAAESVGTATSVLASDVVREISWAVREIESLKDQA